LTEFWAIGLPEWHFKDPKNMRWRRASRYAEVRLKDPASMRAAMEANMAKWSPLVSTVGLKPE
jgi:hypothetical protein